MQPRLYARGPSILAPGHEPGEETRATFVLLLSPSMARGGRCGRFVLSGAFARRPQRVAGASTLRGGRVTRGGRQAAPAAGALVAGTLACRRTDPVLLARLFFFPTLLLLPFARERGRVARFFPSIDSCVPFPAARVPRAHGYMRAAPPCTWRSVAFMPARA